MRSGVVEQRHGRGCTGVERCGCPWSYRVDTPESVDGRRRQIRKGGFRTKTEAREALADIQRRLASGEQVGGALRVAEYLEEWMQAKATAGRRDSTLAGYRGALDRYLVPHLGQVRLSDLRARHIEAMLATMTSEGRGIPTLHRTVAALSSALSAAERRRLIPYNVCRQVEIPPERPAKRPVYDTAQLVRFLADVESDRLAALWRVYAVVGLRRGEALALTWSMVNFDAGTVRIERSLGIVDGRLAWGPPKSESGRRTIRLDDTTVAALRMHRSRQSAEKLALGPGYTDDDLVFAREDGAPLRPEYVSDQFHVLAAGADLPRIHLHDLRHSAASLALTVGVPMKVVSENLGHSSMRITSDVYSHVTTDLAKESAEKVAAALSGIGG